MMRHAFAAGSGLVTGNAYESRIGMERELPSRVHGIAMKTHLFAVLLFCLPAAAFASDAAWISVANNVFLDRQNLHLNGAGVRTKQSLDVYIAALYLVDKKAIVGEVLSDEGEKRIALHVLTVINAGQLQGAFNEEMLDNLGPADMAEIATPLAEFAEIFRNMNEVSKGDVIALDYLPGRGTWISLNGKLYGTIAGSAFYKALLKIWLGDRPVQDDLKLKLLGQY